MLKCSGQGSSWRTEHHQFADNKMRAEQPRTWTHLGPIYPFSHISPVLTQRVDWQGPLTANDFQRGFASNRELCGRVSSSQASPELKQPPGSSGLPRLQPFVPTARPILLSAMGYFSSGTQPSPPLLPATVLMFGKLLPTAPHPLWFDWHGLYDVLGKWLVNLNLALITWPTVSSWSWVLRRVHAQARLCHPLQLSPRIVTRSVGTVNDLIVSSPEGRDPGVFTAICPSDFLGVSSTSRECKTGQERVLGLWV